ncbi:MAG: molybdopterin-guanine dinucleotide biosynthesis protein MobA [Aeromicrobium sp.]|jgi:CTP:molybdopterin cytidylyltransferase MocA|nr:molybdopterin-guanine dinucleotide biosynthesis protein MobA [Aeromicrobium sp.]
MSGPVGLLLAAGAGRRMGMPKALVRGDDDIPWAVSASRTLRIGGCAEVVVVIGAESARVRAVLAHEPVTVVEAADWAAGMGASLRAGLATLSSIETSAALIQLVDLPDVGADVVARFVDLAAPAALARAHYGDRPGHPVLIGRDHWEAVAEGITPDRGAQSFLTSRNVVNVDCSDLATGVDVDSRGPMLAG